MSPLLHPLAGPWSGFVSISPICREKAWLGCAWHCTLGALSCGKAAHSSIALTKTMLPQKPKSWQLYAEQVQSQGAPWCEHAPAPRPLADREESPYQRTRLVGALDAMTGEVMVLKNKHISTEIFSRFLHQVDAAHRDVEIIYVIWDNWPVHQSELVKDTLAQLPRIKVVTLPTYAPWLNPIEKLWRKFRQELDYLHPLAHDWKAWQAQVMQFFAQLAKPSPNLLRYVGLLGEGKLARALHGT